MSKQLDKFQQWQLRRILKITCANHEEEEVLYRMNMLCLQDIVADRGLSFTGHIPLSCQMRCAKRALRWKSKMTKTMSNLAYHVELENCRERSCQMEELEVIDNTREIVETLCKLNYSFISLFKRCGLGKKVMQQYFIIENNTIFFFIVLVKC